MRGMLHENRNWSDLDITTTDSILVSPLADRRDRGIRIDGIDGVGRRFLRLESPLPISKVNDAPTVVLVNVVGS